MIPDISSLLIFIAATIGLLIIPGPAVLYIVAQSIDQGRRAGIFSTLGIAVGTLFHVVAAALGITIILQSSAEAFMIMKYLGAAYLIYLGITRLISKENLIEKEVVKQSLKKIFARGIIVNILNPKTALFFFAFLPQFVDPLRGSVTPQVIFLGMLFVIMGMLSDGVYAILAGTLRDWLRNNPSFLKIQGYISGGIYLALGLATALSGGRK